MSLRNTTLALLVMLCPLFLGSCASVARQPAADPGRNLSLVVTDLVAALIQVPSLNPTVTTLQFSEPRTALGKKLLVALESAGYGMQLVDTDEGQNYVSYAVRTAETEAGIVNDYLIKINEVELRREYNTTPAGIFPSSLMFVKGVGDKSDFVLSEQIFAEQGGGELFLSGIDPGRGGVTDPAAIREVYTDENLRINEDKRLDQQVVFTQARKATFDEAKRNQLASVSGYEGVQKVVVLFPDNRSLSLGPGNKTAIRLLLEKYESGDIFNIAACDDVDGRNEMSERRAIRVKEEFMSHKVPSSAIRLAECTRTNFRHHSDDSPTPVTITQLRAPRVSLN